MVAQLGGVDAPCLSDFAIPALLGPAICGRTTAQRIRFRIPAQPQRLPLRQRSLLPNGEGRSGGPSEGRRLEAFFVGELCRVCYPIPET